MRAVIARLAEIMRCPRVGLVLKLSISATLIALVCRGLDFATVAHQLANQSMLWLAATVLLGLLQIGLLSLRWQQILRGLGSDSGLVSALVVTFMGCFFGAFLFGPTGGDVARAVLAPPRSLGRRGVVHSVVFERLASTIGLGLAVAPVVALASAVALWRVPLLISLSVAPATFLMLAIIACLARLCGGREGALCAALREFDQSRRRLLRVWPRFAIAVGLATIGQLLVAVEAWCLAQSQHLDVPLVDFAILMPPVMLLVALPISAGGWGLREGAIVTALGLVGVGTAPALLLSIELGLIGTLVSLPGGVLWLHRVFSRAKPSRSVA